MAYLNGICEEGVTCKGHLYFKGDVLYSYGPHFPLAVKNGPVIIVNADQASVTTNVRHRALLFQEVPNTYRLEIPFSALAMMARHVYQETAVIAKELCIIDWEPDRYIDTGRISETTGDKIYEHVLGGAVFTYKGRWFVTGMDRSGVDPRGLFFLTEIDENQIDKYGEPASWQEAMELLKPDEVKKFERDGYDVRRQGEWFFVKGGFGKDLVMIDDNAVTRNYELVHRSGKEPAHFVSEGFLATSPSGSYHVVRGIVKHKRKEHKQLKLYDVGEKSKDRSWYVAYESVQGNSWKAGGTVD
jgi:hypothetical protein